MGWQGGGRGGRGGGPGRDQRHRSVARSVHTEARPQSEARPHLAKLVLVDRAAGHVARPQRHKGGPSLVVAPAPGRHAPGDARHPAGLLVGLAAGRLAPGDARHAYGPCGSSGACLGPVLVLQRAPVALEQERCRATRAGGHQGAMKTARRVKRQTAVGVVAGCWAPTPRTLCARP
jgi:hypothetical protein